MIEFKILFPHDDNERTETESATRGWQGGVRVELSDGRIFEFEFYDSSRLLQDIERSLQTGNRFYFEPMMIVVPEVTRPTILNAIQALADQGYFNAGRLQ